MKSDPRRAGLGHSEKVANLAALVALACAVMPAYAAEDNVEDTLPEINVIGTAQETLKQAPGVSIITAEDIQKRPPVNDLSEIIRTQPGVNLTGNSTSGQRGNNRQIDIRGMGPENTLILIDGRPVTSRNSVRYGWRGERDSRGDTNWVPAEQVERIEVLRGPAAARYGNGAAGGVVNIITKGPAKETHGSITAYTNIPEHSEYGATRKINFNLSGPLAENLSYRLYGNISKTDADDYDVNEDHSNPRTGLYAGTYPAGREGVRNRDVGARLSWKLSEQHSLDFDATFSRQGNIYGGDTQNTNNFTTTATGDLNALAQRVQTMLGRETNIIYRDTVALTHRGKYDFGTSMAYLQYESTRNNRLNEGLAGGTEGLFSSNEFTTSRLKGYTAHAEMNLPSKLGGLDQVWTVGTEWVRQTLDDPNSMTQTLLGGDIPGMTSIGRASETAANIFSLFVEDNIALTDRTILTPGLRYDHHSRTGDNWSPALNLSHGLDDNWTLKTGIARAYKAPNLYQTNTNYLLYSNGIGCWGASGACYLRGNDDLEAETSINKELGIEYSNNGVLAGLTYFRNDYKNKIEAGIDAVGQATTGNTANIFQWENIPKAVVEGLEGTLKLPLASNLEWSNNFTYMLTSKNKTTGEVLSVIPKYTVNSILDWKYDNDLSFQATMSWFGKQEPKKYDYQGNRVSGYSAKERSPYALFGVSGTYVISPSWRVTTGVSNLFGKRLYRRGNASGVGTAPNVISGAGAETYNEPGRALYISLTSSF